MSTTSRPDTARGSHGWLRPAAVVALLAAAVALLPVAALLVEAVVEDAGVVISLVHLVLVTGAGAATGGAVARLGPPTTPPLRRATVWAAVGLGAAVVAQLVWYLLLGGLWA